MGVKLNWNEDGSIYNACDRGIAMFISEDSDHKYYMVAWDEYDDDTAFLVTPFGDRYRYQASAKRWARKWLEDYLAQFERK